MQAMEPKPENLKPVSSGKQPRAVRLVDEVIRYGEVAYSPELQSENRTADVTRFNNLLSETKTLALLPVLTSLVQPGRVQEWLRPHIARALALLPLRPQGVRHTIEFILSVHPSTTPQASSEHAHSPESRGPSISLEALNSASRLISSPPSDMSPDIWYSAVAPQLFSLLDGQGGLEMIRAAAFIIGYGILGRKAVGAPGTAGWRNFAEPIISHIDPTLSNPTRETSKKSDLSVAEVPFIQAHHVLVPASGLAEALRRLASLLSSHPNPGLSKRLLEPLLLPLWSLSSWTTNSSKVLEDQFMAPARYLLQISLQLSSGGVMLMRIAQSILYKGNRDEGEILWIYESDYRGEIQIKRLAGQDDTPSTFDENTLPILGQKVDAFIELLKPLKDNDDVPSLFLSLCRKWLLTTDEGYEPDVVLADSRTTGEHYMESRLVESMVIQKLIDALPDRLVSNSTQILELAVEVLNEAIRGLRDIDHDDNVAVTLSLLNMVFSSGKPLTDQPLKNSIKNALKTITKSMNSDTSNTARSLLMFLDFQTAEAVTLATTSTSYNRNLEDRRTYSLAYSYITGTDSPPPVRAQGLDLISSLIVASSPVLDIPSTLILLLSLLQDDEEYIYLRVIKTLTQFSNKHPRAVMLSLLERYVDIAEITSLDSRLRVGEALLQVIQKTGQIFTGDLAQEVSNGLLAIAGRRGYKPNQEAEQRKKADLKNRKIGEAEEAWNGPVPQLEDGDEAEDPILAQIVQGWEGKKGEEDVRIRASALSIFGSAMETNIRGPTSSTISSAVDLSIHILTLEPQHEKAILRRAAALLIMSLVWALDKAREAGTKLGFGFAGQSLDDVLRILKYVSETDNDGLVRQHAKDVMEGLGTSQMKGLVAPQDPQGIEIGELAGLSIGPSRGTRNHRIEEIE